MVSGWAMSLLQASHAGRRWRRSFEDGFESQFSRRYCQTFSSGFSSGAGRQEDQRDVVWHNELARQMPAGPIEQQHGVGAPARCGRFRRDGGASCPCRRGQDQGRAHAAGRADRAEQISLVVSLICGSAWPRAAPGPLPDRRSSGRSGPRPRTRSRPASSRQPFELSLQRARESLWNGPPLLPAS